MRPIKFRGLAGGKWVYGSYALIEGYHFIIPFDSIVESTQRPREAFNDHERFVVDGNTVSQFTGLLDKTGKEIYEGDVVRILYTDWGSQLPDKDGKYKLSLEDYKKSISSIGSVIFKNDRWCIEFDAHEGSIYEGTHGEKEVIGNIYENPELIKN